MKFGENFVFSFVYSIFCRFMWTEKTVRARGENENK